MAFELSLALQGLYIGCLDKVEAILITEINNSSAERDKELLKLIKYIGLINGPIIGYIAYKIGDQVIFGVHIYTLSVPGIVQFASGVLMLLIYIVFSVEIFTPSTLQVPGEQNLFNRTESLALVNASVQLQKTIEKLHLPIFTAMFVALIFSFSRSIKEVALPILLRKSSKFDNCECELTFELDGIYIGFSIVSAFEMIGVFLLYRLRNKIDYKRQIFIPLILSLIGQCLMICESKIPLSLLISGLALQSLSIPLGISATGNFLHQIIGYDPPAYFSVIYMILELLGSLIGPFWTIQAYLVKCQLCFTMISVCVGGALVMLIISIKELVDNEREEKEKLDLELKNPEFKLRSQTSFADRDSLYTKPKNSERAELEMTILKKLS